MDEFVYKIGDDQNNRRQQDDFAEMEDVAFERIPHFLPDGSDIALGKLFKDGFCLECGGLEARLLPIMAASMGMVPLPHMGSIKGVSGQ